MHASTPRTNCSHVARFVFLALLCVARTVFAQASTVTSFDGQLVLTNPPSTAPASGMLTQTGPQLQGTITLTLPVPDATGVYTIHGYSNGSRFMMRGRNDARARLSWTGLVTANGFDGKVRLMAPSGRLRGTLTFVVHPVPIGAGADLFAQNCSACHGADGRGLAGRPDIHCNKSIHDTVRNGRAGSIGVMPSFANLSDADIAAIQEFLNTLCAAPTGAELFASNCAVCHGADATGQPGRPNVQCSVRSRILNAVRTGRGNGLMPIFPAVALPNAQVDEITAYLGTLCSGLPGDQFASNCATCHGATAGGSHNANNVPGPNVRCADTQNFLEKVQFGSDAMPPFPELTTTDINGIASYVLQNFCPLGG